MRAVFFYQQQQRSKRIEGWRWLLNVWLPVAVAIAGVKGIPVEEITTHATLQGELGFDSLMLTELLEALDAADVEMVGGLIQ